VTIHWSNAFSFRWRVKATADAKGKPTTVLGPEILEMIGLKPGEEALVKVASPGVLTIVRPDVQIP
jgi:hypothetical protein